MSGFRNFEPGQRWAQDDGTLTERASGPTRIVTGDRDLFQLVDDSRGVAVLYTASRGVSRAELVDADWLVRRYDIPPGTYGDYSILRGDPSDGLPGVRGVGERTAATLLLLFRLSAPAGTRYDRNSNRIRRNHDRRNGRAGLRLRSPQQPGMRLAQHAL